MAEFDEIGEESPNRFPPAEMRYELNKLWSNFQYKKHQIMMEEFQRDIERKEQLEDIIYVENYMDHWKIKVLKEQTIQEGLNIKRKYGI